MDYQATLYNPIYRSPLGVPATITPGSTAEPADVTVIDKTAGLVVPGSGIALETIKPGAVVRMVELAANGIARIDLEGGAITFNGATWKILGTLPRPSPKGEADGELLLILEAA